jgi:hypothetical protein
MILSRAISPSYTPFRQVHDFLEQAVETVPDEDPFFHRLDVDVARLALDRALHDQIDQVDDRRRFRCAPSARQPARQHFFFDPPRQRHRRSGRRCRGRRAAGAWTTGRSPPARCGSRASCASARLVRIARLNGVVDVAAGGDDLLMR